MFAPAQFGRSAASPRLSRAGLTAHSANLNDNTVTQVLVSALIIGVSLSVGLILFYRNWRFVRNSLATKGSVIELKKRGMTKAGKVLYSPVVRFFAADGSQIEFTEFIRRHPAGFAVGEQVDVLYDRREFKNARCVKSKWDLYFPAWIFLLVGGLLLLAGAVVAIVYAVVTLLLGPLKSK